MGKWFLLVINNVSSMNFNYLWIWLLVKIVVILLLLSAKKSKTFWSSLFCRTADVLDM